MSAPKSYHSIIIGGGHNGLVCAATLARAGKSVLLLESAATLGGAAETQPLGNRAEIAQMTQLHGFRIPTARTRPAQQRTGPNPEAVTDLMAPKRPGIQTGLTTKNTKLRMRMPRSRPL